MKKHFPLLILVLIFCPFTYIPLFSTSSPWSACWSGTKPPLCITIEWNALGCAWVVGLLLIQLNYPPLSKCSGVQVFVKKADLSSRRYLFIHYFQNCWINCSLTWISLFNTWKSHLEVCYPILDADRLVNYLPKNELGWEHWAHQVPHKHNFKVGNSKYPLSQPIQ